MFFDHQINYMNRKYKVLAVEQEYLIHPSVFGYLPLTKATQYCNFTGSFHVEGYKLYLDQLVLNPGAGSKSINPENNERIYDFDHYPVAYTGSVLIGTQLVKEYGMKGMKPTYFSYLHVLELIFEDGVLITTVDQSKAMLRIRKNLELGIRSLVSSRDNRCINRFMNSVFIGEYKPFLLQKQRMHYLKEMQKQYKIKNGYVVTN